MNLKILMTALTVATVSATAYAGVSAEEASRLGKDLTLFGAEKAGNKEGTIPEYTGGLKTPPPDYKPGSGIYVDPFKDEKPLYSITQANMEQYADKLAEGQKALLKKYPDYRMDVYPTHRTRAFPQRALEETVKNATRASSLDGGLRVEGAEGGMPFPIPKNGREAMWNHLLVHAADPVEWRGLVFYVDQTGRRVVTGDADFHVEFPYYQPDNPERKTTYEKIWIYLKAPAAIAGQQILIVDRLNGERQAWLYIPGQRRVKLAPELAYDTPSPTSAGIVTWDDSQVFFGKMDRFSFKLVGKKEMLIPYNVYKMMSGTMEQVGTPKFLNPDYMRWELHRVWVVEAELLPDKRHIYKKRIFYWDEDGFNVGMSDQYDHAGKLLRHNLSILMPFYDQEGYEIGPFLQYDFSSNIYIATALPMKGMAYRSGSSIRKWKPSEWTPEALAGRAVR